MALKVDPSQTTTPTLSKLTSREKTFLKVSAVLVGLVALAAITLVVAKYGFSHSATGHAATKTFHWIKKNNFPIASSTLQKVFLDLGLGAFAGGLWFMAYILSCNPFKQQAAKNPTQNSQ